MRGLLSSLGGCLFILIGAVVGIVASILLLMLVMWLYLLITHQQDNSGYGALGYIVGMIMMPFAAIIGAYIAHSIYTRDRGRLEDEEEARRGSTVIQRPVESDDS